jgi:hypothetical protein
MSGRLPRNITTTAALRWPLGPFLGWPQFGAVILRRARLPSQQDPDRCHKVDSSCHLFSDDLSLLAGETMFDVLPDC